MPGRSIGKNMLAGRPLKSGRSAKERKRGSKNIEIAKRLFIAHNALPLLEATGGASGTARGKAIGRAAGTARGRIVPFRRVPPSAGWPRQQNK